MKKYLIPENGNFYKANLHCHTTVSDGEMTPEQTRDYYMAHGYSLIAFTDHDVLIPHPELNIDGKFLALNGYEMEINEDSDSPRRKTCHICLVALEPDNLTQVCYHREKYVFRNAVNYRDRVNFDESLPDYERVFTHECINDMIKKGREGGFFVTYNHPAWSLENYTDYSGYEGMNAMEIVNFGCVIEGYPDHNERVYDDMLAQGKRIYCTCTDDNHHIHDCCGGWTVIKADSLEYRTVTKALEQGSFYSSEGPEIKELYIEDGRVHIETSPCRYISFIPITRACRIARGTAENPVTHASFELNPDRIGFRIEVTGLDGFKAYTNAYFLDSI